MKLYSAYAFPSLEGIMNSPIIFVHLLFMSVLIIPKYIEHMFINMLRGLI